VRTGNASASAESSVTSSDGETVVDVHVETDVDGTETSESYSEEFSGDKPVVVEVGAKASNKASETTVKVNGEEVADTTTASTTDDDEIVVAAEVEVSIFERISTAFSGFFSFFKFW
jgi:hypothetical protein